MFWRILRKSLVIRKNHFMIAVIAVTMGALLVAATASISLNIKSKISKELRAYGPNLLILPAADALGMENGAVRSAQSYLSLGDIETISKDSDIMGISATIEGMTSWQNHTFPVIGLNWEAAQRIHPWWQLDGEGPEGNKLVLGQVLARKLNITKGQLLRLTSGTHTLDVEISGIAQLGGDEDSKAFLALDQAQHFFEQHGKISALEVSVLNSGISLEEKGNTLVKQIPGSRSKVIQQVAQAEQLLLQKIQALMVFVTAGVLVASLLSIAGTMTTAVLQRRKEIGIMKAIGALNRDIAKLFLAEASVFSILGGMLGLLGGFGLAQVIGLTVFSTSIRFSPLVIPLTLGCAFIVTWLASIRPVLQALAVEPALTLRGE